MHHDFLIFTPIMHHDFLIFIPIIHHYFLIFHSHSSLSCLHSHSCIMTSLSSLPSCIMTSLSSLPSSITTTLLPSYTSPPHTPSPTRKQRQRGDNAPRAWRRPRQRTGRRASRGRARAGLAVRADRHAHRAGRGGYRRSNSLRRPRTRTVRAGLRVTPKSNTLPRSTSSRVCSSASSSRRSVCSRGQPYASRPPSTRTLQHQRGQRAEAARTKHHGHKRGQLYASRPRHAPTAPRAASAPPGSRSPGTPARAARRCLGVTVPTRTHPPPPPRRSPRRQWSAGPAWPARGSLPLNRAYYTHASRAARSSRGRNPGRPTRSEAAGWPRGRTSSAPPPGSVEAKQRRPMLTFVRRGRRESTNPFTREKLPCETWSSRSDCRS